MINQSTSPATRARLDNEDRIDLQARAGSIKEDKAIVSRHHIFKWFGCISSALLSAAALAPNIFKVPANLQPWVFLTAIFWVLAFCAGMFDL